MILSVVICTAEEMPNRPSMPPFPGRSPAPRPGRPIARTCESRASLLFDVAGRRRFVNVLLLLVLRLALPRLAAWDVGSSSRRRGCVSSTVQRLVVSGKARVSGLDVAGVDVATLLIDLSLLVDKAVVEVRSEVRGLRVKARLSQNRGPYLQACT